MLHLNTRGTTLHIGSRGQKCDISIALANDFSPVINRVTRRKLLVVGVDPWKLMYNHPLQLDEVFERDNPTSISTKLTIIRFGIDYRAEWGIWADI